MEMNERKEQLVEERVPNECPFCRAIDKTEWTEMEVHLVDVTYFDKKEFVKKSREDIKVFCTRCEEEIRQEDC